MVEMMIRHYRIYLIEDAVVVPYIGREKLLYGLFNDFIQAKGRQKWIVGRQILYITKKMPIQLLRSVLEKELCGNQNISYLNGAYYVRYKGQSSVLKSSAKLTIHNRVLTISSEGGYDAETVFFECIRKIDHSFLAIDIEHERYGWLKPFKERKFI